MDKEFFLLFSVMDENQSWYMDENIEMFGNAQSDSGNEDFEESNLMHGKDKFYYTVSLRDKLFHLNGTNCQSHISSVIFFMRL